MCEWKKEYVYPNFSPTFPKYLLQTNTIKLYSSVLANTYENMGLLQKMLLPSPVQGLLLANSMYQKWDESALNPKKKIPYGQHFLDGIKNYFSDRIHFARNLPSETQRGLYNLDCVLSQFTPYYKIKSLLLKKEERSNFIIPIGSPSIIVPIVSSLYYRLDDESQLYARKIIYRGLAPPVMHFAAGVMMNQLILKLIEMGLGQIKSQSIVTYNPAIMRCLRGAFLSISILLFLNNIDSSYEQHKKSLSKILYEQLAFWLRDKSLKQAKSRIAHSKEKII